MLRRHLRRCCCCCYCSQRRFAEVKEKELEAASRSDAELDSEIEIRES